MKNQNNIYLDLDVVMNELKEALSTQGIGAIGSESDLDDPTEKILHLFVTKEFDLLLLFIKTLATKHEIALPRIFNSDYYNDELKEPLCAAIIENWSAIVKGVPQKE